jgi:hypothetical protein
VAKKLLLPDCFVLPCFAFGIFLHWDGVLSAGMAGARLLEYRQQGLKP